MMGISTRRFPVGQRVLPPITAVSASAVRSGDYAQPAMAITTPSRTISTRAEDFGMLRTAARTTTRPEPC